MVNCKNCGAPLSLEEAVCPHCGSRMSGSDSDLNWIDEMEELDMMLDD